MKQYLAKKLKEALVTFFVVASCVFFLMHFAPGSPFADERILSDEAAKALNAHYGLDKPLMLQYIRYLKGLCIGDLGPSLSIEGLKVFHIIKQAFPISLKLGSLAFVLSITLGLSVALGSIFLKSKSLTKASKATNLMFLAMPSFIASVLLQYVFSIVMPLFPATGYNSFSHFILPALSLSLIPAGVIAKLLKTKLQDVLCQPYILSAKAKGLSFFRILIFHIFPGALLPLLAYLGPLAATLITGSFAAEKVFALPGLGSWFVMSLNARDYPLIAGLTLFYTFFVLSFSFLVDLIYCLLDPKIKQELV